VEHTPPHNTWWTTPESHHTEHHDQERRTGQPSRKEQPDYMPTKRYHGIMLIHNSIGTEAVSHSPALYWIFNVLPVPRESTAACFEHP